MTILMKLTGIQLIDKCIPNVTAFVFECGCIVYHVKGEKKPYIVKTSNIEKLSIT